MVLQSLSFKKMVINEPYMRSLLSAIKNNCNITMLKFDSCMLVKLPSFYLGLSNSGVLLPLRLSAGQAPGIKYKNMMLSVSVKRKAAVLRTDREGSGQAHGCCEVQHRLVLLPYHPYLPPVSSPAPKSRFQIVKVTEAGAAVVALSEVQALVRAQDQSLDFE
ncbi:hypothetical protein NQ318_017775 [Aromia moschata]|uniref:Uncharacterized protein n=1 Tax=Aromia moschata TaxID=1265417 RepID=A0AAV8XXJ8_9CUCU|nr:hypothetical protein NQ318_017775 [Aromia moschata]